MIPNNVILVVGTAERNVLCLPPATRNAWGLYHPTMIDGAAAAPAAAGSFTERYFRRYAEFLAATNQKQKLMLRTGVAGAFAYYNCVARHASTPPSPPRAGCTVRYPSQSMCPETFVFLFPLCPYNVYRCSGFVRCTRPIGGIRDGGKPTINTSTLLNVGIRLRWQGQQ